MQILVVVAITQMRTLRTEEGKGSVRTVFDHGLVGPKIRVNSLREGRFATLRVRKGIR